MSADPSTREKKKEWPNDMWFVSVAKISAFICGNGFYPWIDKS